jgi:hypothetical protein
MFQYDPIPKSSPSGVKKGEERRGDRRKEGEIKGWT